MNPIAEEWFKSAKDDLITVEEIIDNELITNISAFHGQQCIEKCFKALLAEKGSNVPKIHSLLALYESVKDYLNVDLDEEILDKLDKLYIDARYPSAIGFLPTGKPPIEEAKRFYSFAKFVYDSIERLINI
jgi:HEPN domain-containing protein